MALPDYFKLEQGTAVIWGDAGATSGVTVTNNMTLDALANDAGRMGASGDFGALWEMDYAVYLWIETGTAPTAGNQYELYMAESHDGINWPGKVTGADAAYPTTVDDNKKQLNFITSLFVTADTNITLKQGPVYYTPAARYIVPVVVNKSGQALRDRATASDNGSRVILVPIRRSVQD